MKKKAKAKLLLVLASLLVLAGITVLDTKIFLGLGLLTFSLALATINKGD